MKRMFIALSAAALMPLLAPAHALPDYQFCDGCNEAGYRSTAMAHRPADPEAVRYEVYVADFTNEILRRFRVTVIHEPDVDFSEVRALTPLETEIQRFEGFIAARSEILQSLAVFDFTVEIPPGYFVDSAYDLWGSRQKQLLVREFINSELSMLETAFSNMFAFGSFLLDRSASKLFIKVEFPDGSVAIFELTGKMEDLVWEYAESQSVDRDGNLIPDRLSDFAEYSGLFNALSVQDFLVRAMLYGIPIVDESTGTQRTSVVCVHSANGSYSCVVTSPK